MRSLGYSLSFNHVNASRLGVPQNRERLFIVATRTTKPIVLELPEKGPIAARSFIDMDMHAYKWDHISNRVLATQKRVTNGRKQFGEVFLDAAYGSARSGRSIDNPIGTITTINKHSLVIGDLIRPLSLRELAAAQTFDECYQWPASATATKMMIGNAVPPVMAKEVISAVLKAA